MANGVEVNGKKLLIYFKFEGEHCREPLKLPDTPANVAYAESMVRQINADIDNEHFNYARWLPESAKGTPARNLAGYVAGD